MEISERALAVAQSYEKLRAGAIAHEAGWDRSPSSVVQLPADVSVERAEAVASVSQHDRPEAASGCTLDESETGGKVSRVAPDDSVGGRRSRPDSRC